MTSVASLEQVRQSQLCSRNTSATVSIEDGPPTYQRLRQHCVTSDVPNL